MSALVWIALGAAVVAVLYLVYRLVGNGRLRARSGYPDIPLVVPPIPYPPVAKQPVPGTRPEPRSDADSSPIDAQLFEGRTIRFYRPPTRTLQMVPGRLEVVAGEDRSEEIRFVRVPGSPIEVTLGRREGEPLRHIQFRAPTVSRDHARMVYANAHWVITNHSRTNPVVINGIELAPPRDQHVLTEGDRIEMGEVVFRFHER